MLFIVKENVRCVWVFVLYTYVLYTALYSNDLNIQISPAKPVWNLVVLRFCVMAFVSATIVGIHVFRVMRIVL